MKRFYLSNSLSEEYLEERIRGPVVDRRANNEGHRQDRAAVFIENDDYESTTLFNC